MADTVENARNTPDEVQPYQALGLKDDEYARIKEILGRRPTSSELAMYSVMWSEHCSYKSSKVHLRRFGALSQDTPRGPLLAGIGENAGVVDVGDGWAVTFKVESHNHPSFVEPHQGAATGVGGIVRDILAMGARPVGVMDSLRFGPLDAHDTHRVLPGVVSGVGDYGNCLGLPNIGGESAFDATYAMNPLVNAFCVGVLRHDDLHTAHASGVGNKVILYGAATGGDGIGGASILASETFDADGPAKRPSVQVGDPFMEKLLIECTLELFAENLIAGIQDLGAAGISCATSELASAGDGGMHVVLDDVPLRDHTLAPEEILMSESQERMCAVVTPDNIERFMAVCARWDVEATVIGEVIEGDRLLIDWHGERLVDVDPRTVAHDGPVYERPLAQPESHATRQADAAEALERPVAGSDIAATLTAMIASPHLCDRTWITQQYDCFVRGNTVAHRPEPAGVLRIDATSGAGMAVAMRGNGRMTQLDPYIGAQHSLCDAYRAVAMTGAEPVAISDCLNYGSPEDPAVMWQFSRAIDALVDGCGELGTPVTGGNVSFYNQTGDTPILPTPTIAVMGVIDDVTTTVGATFAHPGDALVLLGATAEELSGSVWADVAHEHLGGVPPKVDLAAEKALAACVREAVTEELLSSATPVSAGGLAEAVVSSALRGGYGAAITLPDGDAAVQLFSESNARAVVSLPGEAVDRFAEMCGNHGVPIHRLGEVTGRGDIEIEGVARLELSELARLAAATLPEVMDAPVA